MTSRIELSGVVRVAPSYICRRKPMREQQPSQPSEEEISRVCKNLFGSPKPNEASKLYHEEQMQKMKDFNEKYVIMKRVETKPEAEQYQHCENILEFKTLTKPVVRKELCGEHSKSYEVQEEKCNMSSAMMSCTAAEITPPPTQSKKRRMGAAAGPAITECSGSCVNYCDYGAVADSAGVKSFGAIATKQSLITDNFVQRKFNPAIKSRSSVSDVDSSSPSPSFSSSSTNTNTLSNPPTVAADTSTSTYPRMCDSAPCDSTTAATTTSQQKLVLSLQITTTEMTQRRQPQQSSLSSL